MPSLFLKSSKNIRKIFETNEKEFIKSISDKKDLETKNIQQEYDKMILEIESEIKENEQKNLTDPEKYKLNDESLKKISILREEQNKMILILSEKYKIIFSYDLISVMIFLYG